MTYTVFLPISRGACVQLIPSINHFNYNKAKLPPTIIVIINVSQLLSPTTTCIWQQ